MIDITTLRFDLCGARRRSCRVAAWGRRTGKSVCCSMIKYAVRRGNGFKPMFRMKQRRSMLTSSPKNSDQNFFHDDGFLLSTGQLLIQSLEFKSEPLVVDAEAI